MESRKLEDLIPRSDNPSLWRNEGGRLIMPALQSEFLDWLLTPEPEKPEGQKTQAQWAATHGVNAGTVGTWKKDRRFRMMWEDRAAEKNISVDRIQGVIDTLHGAALAGDVQAAKLYLQHVEKMRPPVEIVRDDDVAGVSDEDLKSEIAALIAEEG